MFRVVLIIAFIVPSYQFCQTCSDCSSTQNTLCSCDADCGIFGDCCGSLSPPHSCPPPSLNPLLPGVVLECQSIYWNASTPASSENGFLMVSSCPTCYEEVQESSGIIKNCTSKDILLPPVTDLKAGLVYRNEYCAYCNGVEELVTWQIDLACSETVHKAILQSNLSTLVGDDPEIIQRDCQEWLYRLQSFPSEISPSRFCVPTINYCLTKVKLENKIGNISSVEYSEMEKNCSLGKLDPIQGMNGQKYRNRFCAKCNGIQIRQCIMLSETGEHNKQNNGFPLTTDRNIYIVTVTFTSDKTISFVAGQSSLLLNLSGPEGNLHTAFLHHKMPCSFMHSQGKKYCSNFMEFLNQCHRFPTNCSSMKYVVNRTHNYSSRYRVLSSLSCANDSSCQSGFKLLNDSEYKIFWNGSILYNNELLDELYYDTDFQVFICKVNEDDLVRLICHYVAHSLTLIGVALIAITFGLFKKIRNLPATIIMIYSIPILLNSILHLFTEHRIVVNKTLQVIFAIAFHYISLVELTWMVIFSYEVVRKFYLGLRIKQDTKKSQKRHLLAYLLIGWLPSLLLVSIAVILNFTTHNLVSYGLNNRGVYILHFHSFLAAEGLYALLCIAVSIILFIIITILICSRARAKFKLKQQKGLLTLLRLWIAVVCLSSLSYIPYFINDPQWLVYTVDYYNESRGIFVFLAFFLTKKVLKLYYNLFCCVSDGTTSSRKAQLTTFTQSSSSYAACVRETIVTPV